MLRGEKNLAENFDEEWFNILKGYPGIGKRTPSEQFEEGSKILTALRALNVTPSTAFTKVGNALERFNNIFLYNQTGKKVYRPGLFARLIGIYLANTDLAGIGPALKGAHASLENWFKYMGTKMNKEQIARLQEEYEKFKKITEEE